MHTHLNWTVFVQCYCEYRRDIGFGKKEKFPTYQLFGDFLPTSGAKQAQVQKALKKYS